MSLRVMTVIFSGILLLPLGYAETYYVGRVVSASDAHPGTDVAKPWRTLSAAAQRATAGDTVMVLDGDYRDEDIGWGAGVIPITRSGREKEEIRFQASTGARPLVGRMLLQKVSFIRIEGLHFQGLDFRSAFPKWSDMPSIVRDEPESALKGVDYLDAWEKREERIRAAFATYFRMVAQLEYQVGVNLEECRSIVVSNNQIDGYWAGVQCRGCDRIAIESNAISHCVNGIYTWHPTPTLTNSRVVGNRISQSLDNGIDIREGAKNVLIESNQVRYSGRSHISVQGRCRDCIVSGNDLMKGGYYSETMQHPGSSGISLHSSLGGNAIEGNTVSEQVDFTQIDGNGIIVDLMIQGAGATVRGNVAERNMGSGLNTTSSPNTIIERNRFIENGLQGTDRRNGAGVKLSREEDIGQTIIQNIFSLNRAAGILALRNIEKQKEVNYNRYDSPAAPFIWDGIADGERAYRTLEEVRRATGWEKNGALLNP